MIIGLPRIRCAICKRQVDSVTVLRDEFKSAHTFIVECHGDTDRCDLTDEFLAHASDGTVTVGEAFATKRVEAAK